ncbi:MAG: hypothetical protein GKR94_06080 [Gammaproteobacteria bacterium]|nr:hypothetical protein [Gammaproteobacteria bacterium]
MSKSEELKERISYLKGFLTVLLGVVVLLSGGLVNLYLSGNIKEIFWLGVGVIVFILLVCFKVMAKIEEHLKELGRI